MFLIDLLHSYTSQLFTCRSTYCTCSYLFYFAWARSKGKCTLISILHTSKVQVCCICPSSGTLGQIQHTCHSLPLPLRSLRSLRLAVCHYTVTSPQDQGVLSFILPLPLPSLSDVTASCCYILLPFTIGNCKSLVYRV